MADKYLNADGLTYYNQKINEKSLLLMGNQLFPMAVSTYMRVKKLYMSSSLGTGKNTEIVG